MINDLTGRLVADKYRVEALVTESDDGDIYRGRHEVLDKAVTIKVLSPALAIDQRWVKRFVDEARAASAVNHPNVLAITDFGTDAKGITYAVFEELTGESLRQLLSGGLVLEEQRALKLSVQIAAAVASAHAKQVIHGGLEPADIFVTGEPGNETVKVSGFGRDPLTVARDADPRYLAPGQCTEYAAADARTDVYALGVILYEMLSGGVPYQGSTPAEILAKQNSEPPAPLSAFRRDLRPEVEPIVLTAISASPERRYQTMAAFCEDLERLNGGVAVKAAAAAAGAPVPAGRHNIWQTAFIVLVGVVVVSGVLIYATSTKRTDPTVQMQAEAGSMPVQPIGPATGAQEESLAKLPAQTDAEILAAASQQQGAGGDLPGGDGYNAWANGGVPPPGAPLNSAKNAPAGSVPAGGGYYTVDPNGGSQFMPSDSGVILVPVPANTVATPRVTPAPRTANSNTAGAQATPAATPRPVPGQTPPGSRVPAGQGTPRPAAPAAGTTTTRPPGTTTP